MYGYGNGASLERVARLSFSVRALDRGPGQDSGWAGRGDGGLDNVY